MTEPLALWFLGEDLNLLTKARPDQEKDTRASDAVKKTLLHRMTFTA